MVVNVTELFTVKRIGRHTLIEWLDEHVGRYIGPGAGMMREDISPVQTYEVTVLVLDIGQGWQLEAHDIVDSYGHTINYYIDIDNEKIATFFILKWT
jgi:hypothetical protein